MIGIWILLIICDGGSAASKLSQYYGIPSQTRPFHKYAPLHQLTGGAQPAAKEETSLSESTDVETENDDLSNIGIVDVTNDGKMSSVAQCQDGDNDSDDGADITVVTPPPSPTTSNENESTTAAAAAMLQHDISEENDEEDDNTEAVVADDDWEEQVVEERRIGKELHDSGDFSTAAGHFSKAASILSKVSSYRDDGDGDDVNSINEDEATCRLHEALCRLKNGDYEACVKICSSVLNDDDNDDGISLISDSETSEIESDESTEKLKSHTGESSKVGTIMNDMKQLDHHDKTFLSAAVRARAHHRRAKGKLSMGDTEGALEDARAAAFLGDRGAVALYGKLMRETDSYDVDKLPNGEGGGFPSFFGATGGKGLDSLASGPSLLDLFLPQGASGDDDSSSSSSNDMMSSLLSPSLLSGLLKGGQNENNKGGMPPIVKSLLQQIDSPSTQRTICTLLKNVSSSQILSLAEQFSLPLSSNMADKLANFASRLTPERIQRGISLSKLGWYMWEILRRTIKVWNKYKTLLVYWLILAWCIRTFR